MKENPKLVNFQVNFHIEDGNFVISKNPIGQETLFMIPMIPKEKIGKADYKK